MKDRPPRHSGQFAAPWGSSVKVVTIATCALVLGLMIILPLTLVGEAKWAACISPVAAAAILAIVTLFCVRGFTIRQRELWIQRLIWQTRFPLAELKSAREDPLAMKGSIRTAGNGGFMAYTGWFWNKRLGKYRAFVTDPERCVVLEFTNRKIVVSPDKPESFVRALGFDPAASGSDE